MKRVLLALLVLVVPRLILAKTGNPEDAVWAGSIFLRGSDPTTHEKLTDRKLTDFGARLEQNGIRYVYIFAGPFQKDGHLPKYPFSARAKASIAFLKKTYPSLKILPWIGGIEGKTVFLEDDAWREASIKDTERLLREVPFDGVHLDLEYVLFPKKSASVPVERYDADWKQFYKRLRERLPDAFLSTVVVSSASGVHPWKHRHEMKDLVEVSRTVDQVSFMYYETGLHDATSYRENMRQQLKQIQRMKADLGSKAPKYLFGIGTFKSEKALASYRDMRFENLSFTLAALKNVVRESFPSERPIDGLAVYCDWTTTPSDWGQFRAYRAISGP